MPNDSLKRLRMVQEQLIPRKIVDPSTLSAMQAVPRHEFVPIALQNSAYEDGPLPIGEGQTISQPYIVALMTQSAELTADSKVLEIGTGSGYQAAILSLIAKEIYSIERVPLLAEHAEKVLKRLHYQNVHLKVGDGSLGWSEMAPFDAILVTAGAPVVPQSLLSQLVENGRLIIPVGDEFGQRLLRYRKGTGGQFVIEPLEYVRFVPLIGQEGW